MVKEIENKIAGRYPLSRGKKITVIFCFICLTTLPQLTHAGCTYLCTAGGGGAFSTCCSSAAEAAAMFTSCNSGMQTVYLGCPDVSNLPPDIGMWYTPVEGYVTCTNCDQNGNNCYSGTVYFGTCEDACKDKDPCACDPSLCECSPGTTAGN